MDAGYIFPCKTPALMLDLPYIVCVLHCRVRLWGHVLDFIAKTINNVNDKCVRKVLCDKLIDQIVNARVYKSIIDVSVDYRVKVYSPSGDAVDNFSINGFDVASILGMSFYPLCHV